MNNAKNTQSYGQRVINDSVNTHKKCLTENMQQYQALHQEFKQKTGTSRMLLDTLNKRIKSVTLSIDKNKHSLAALEQAHRAKEAPHALNKNRLDLRAKRPAREHKRDPFEIKLEGEHQ